MQWKVKYVASLLQKVPTFPSVLSKTVQNQVLDKKKQHLNTQWEDIPLISKNKKAFFKPKVRLDLETTLLLSEKFEKRVSFAFNLPKYLMIRRNF